MLKKRPSPSMVVAITALVFSLTGVGYAATQLSAGSHAHAAKKKSKRGPPGPQGLQGPQGPQGPPGPTAAASSSGLQPSAAQQTFGSIQIVAPTDGRLFVTAQVSSVSVNCNPSAGSTVALYVDGVGVLGTGRGFSNAVAAPYNASGLSGSVPAGAHLVSYGGHCNGGSSVSGFGVGSVSLNSIFVGG